MKYDFSGWATKNNLKCSDGRVIMKDAFKENDGTIVPLVWNHMHNSPENVLGHALLENRDDGVYAYCTLNDTASGDIARALVKHKDITSLSIYANKLKQNGPNVLHGAIREVSLVLSPANPGAAIETIIAHSDDVDEEAVIYTGEIPNYQNGSIIAHSDDEDEQETKKEDDSMDTKKKTDDEKTVKDVLDTFTEEQKTVLYALVGAALEDAGKTDKDDESEGGDNMKHNVFDNSDSGENVLSHSEMAAIFSDAKRYGSLKDSVLAHGIEDIDYLFPDAKTLNNTPEFIKRDMDWVDKVMNGVHHTPFSRIKSIFADITEYDARAKGYIKGNQKAEEVFGLLKRTTTPTTIYKKQKLDRDDVVDITDFDVVAWLKTEMRMMLNEEIARASLIGDGRSSSSDDKINESNIRPIWTDEDLYTIKTTVTPASDDENDVAKAFIRAAIKSRKDYKGSGTPTLFTTEDMLTNCLLMEDDIGRIIYDSEEKLARVLRVKEIVTVPVMEDQTRTNDDGDTVTLMGIIVNLADYNIGADKGGAVNMFDDFDIDYNAQKYLIETRCSGALVKPYSAIALELAPATTEDAG